MNAKYMKIICRYIWCWMGVKEVKACWFEPRWLPQSLLLPGFVHFSIAARWRRNRAEDVIQYLPIKWCPGACLANAANLCTFRDSSLAAAVLVEAGGRLLYLDRPSQQQQNEGSHDGQPLIRWRPEQAGFAPMPQGFVKAANTAAYGANTPPHYLFIHSLWMICWQPRAAQRCDEQDIVV